MKRRFFFILITFILSTLLVFTACGKANTKKADNNSKVSTEENTVGINVNSKVEKNDRNNVEIFLDYIVEADKEIDYWLYLDGMKLLSTVCENYKDDIINKYTGGKGIEFADRTASYFKTQEIGLNAEKERSVDIVYLISNNELKSTDTKEIVYCCCPESKGCIAGFLFMDGIYLYEIDENGNKINEIKHFFKERESTYN